MDDIAIELEALECVFSDASAEPIKLSFGLLRSITEDFSNEIGRGGFGVVYMGYLESGKVAVKKLSSPHALPDEQFLGEITCLKKAKHKNIVRFLGYCSETQGELFEFNGRDVMAEIQTKLLCFEYAPGGNIRHYLQQEKPQGDNWPARYQMIRGICHGLHYLHDKQINHLDLKPENVMLDAQMEPKITDFGLARFLDQGQSKMITEHIVGTLRYIAPEIIDKGEISLKSDIYALGIIIIELLTGISMMSLENWDESLDVDCPRMRRCTEIARNCTDADKHNRPTVREVISDLDELDGMIPRSSLNQVTPTVFPGNELLDVYPLQLSFPFVPNQKMHYNLSVTNKTDGGVYCAIIPDVPHRYNNGGGFKGFLPPMSTTAITLRRKAEEELPSNTEWEILMLITGYNDESIFNKEISTLSMGEDAPIEDKLKAAHELLGFELHLATLTAVAVISEDDDRPLVWSTTGLGEDETVVVDSEDDDRPESMDVHPMEPQSLPIAELLDSWLLSSGDDETGLGDDETIYRYNESMDVHPTEPWVLIIVNDDPGETVCIWNIETKVSIGIYKKPVVPIEEEGEEEEEEEEKEEEEEEEEKEEEEEEEDKGPDDTLAKFIPQKQWVVIGDSSGSILVRMCPTMDQVKEFKAHHGGVSSMEVHPTSPFLLSFSNPSSLKLWDWSRDWSCTRVFDITTPVIQVMFNPKHTGTFATLHEDGTAKMWRIGYPDPVTTTHQLDDEFPDDYVGIYFFTYSGEQHFIAAVDGHKTYIWDLQKEKHVHTLYITETERITAVVCHPTRPVLVIASDEGCIRVWDSTTYRLKKTYSNLRKNPIHLGFTGLRKLVVGYMEGISVMDFDLE